MNQRLFRYLSALSAIVGVVLLVASFMINPGPPEQSDERGTRRVRKAVLHFDLVGRVAAGGRATPHRAFRLCTRRLSRRDRPIRGVGDHVRRHRAHDREPHRDHLLHQRFEP